MTQVQIEAGDDGLFLLPERHYLCIEDRSGEAEVELLVFSEEEPKERLSLSHTRIAHGNIFLAPSSNLVSNRRRVLARICEDDVRAHDILSQTACEFSLSADSLEELERRGVPPWSLHDPVGLFTPIKVGPGGEVERLSSASTRGAGIVFLSRIRLLCALAVGKGSVTATVRDKMPAKV